MSRKLELLECEQRVFIIMGGKILIITFKNHFLLGHILSCLQNMITCTKISKTLRQNVLSFHLMQFSSFKKKYVDFILFILFTYTQKKALNLKS